MGKCSPHADIYALIRANWEDISTTNHRTL